MHGKVVLVIFVVAAQTGVFGSSMSTNDIFNKLKDVKHECYSEKEELQIIETSLGEVLEAVDHNCFVACAYRIFGFLVEGKFMVDHYMDSIAPFHKPTSMEYKKMQNIVDDCYERHKKVESRGECKIAATMIACIMPQVQKNKFKVMI
ncbi:uncharacterized protein LOC113389547 [Ctenocephalides felis]|uniref:uncharacterized protein LOC113389543 n=1 Tax=Ctenocephalides felis TaxID=7515 RepID=UPI000E6E272E|nr:uncharacterized protein LOC113389543 [Ctenocephalides felis]XP_026482354.1 uncharacterized protein LOC113389547 [Ctenocephalides felis]